MARSKNNKATAASRVAVEVGSTGTRSASKLEVVLLVLSIGAAIWAVAMMTTPGKVGYVYFFFYLDYYIGVVSLVSLSITIMVGLVATDRLVLSVRQRVLLQSAHRTTGVIAVGALFAHVWTKFAKDYIGLLDIFVPFLTEGLNKWFVGLGTISGWIMVLVMWSGLARARFIGRGKPWMWRGIHAISYLMWPIALTHGLSAGRPAATWVTVSYIVCVLGVIVGLAVRLSVSLNRRKDFASPAGVGAVKPSETGTLVPTAPAPIRRPARPAAPPVDLLAPAGAPDGGAPTQTWNQPMTRPVSPAPAPAPAPMEEDYPPRGRRQAELEAPPAPRQRRAAEDDERYDTQTRMSRRDVEDERYRYDEEPAPRSRGSRSQEMYDEGPRGRGRRYDDDERYDTQTRMSRRDVEATGTRMRRDDVEATGTRMRREPEYDEPRSRRDVEATGTRMRRDDVEATGTRMRREPEYDDRSRGRRRAEDDYDAAPRGSRSARYEEPRYEEPRYEEPRYQEPRYDEPPRRPSRSEFVDLADGSGGGYPADDAATLVDTGSRRSRRDEPGRGGGRRGGRDDADDAYLSQLRGDVRETN
ncbi:translation initiation factor III [Actinoplanes flavus]|uniref:Translation initiation factor III n=1 Tax=Actinoplanes flavus TaxID=2820290 RepID=A0ABS3V0F9_9ACTN|nr:translation initiation factor III [Actinoplanes flavus]MBO3744302.1 translation initiation factor III [Actinoplanes flavus]